MTRERRWCRELESHWVTRPTVSDGTAFVGVGYRDATGAVLGFGVEDGNQVFNFPCEREVETGLGADGERLYIAPSDGSLRCLSSNDGCQHWECQTPAGVASPLSVVETTLYALTIRSHLLAVDTIEGDVQWQWQGSGAAQSGIEVDDSTVYVATADGCVTALNRRTGAVCWRRSLGSGVVGGLSVIGDKLLLATFDGSVQAVCTLTGKVHWQASVGTCVAGPEIKGSRVAVGDKTGSVHAFERRTGAKQWNISLESGISVKPAIAGEHADVLIDGGRLVSLDTVDGTICSSVSAPPPSPTGALVVSENVRILAGSGRLVCFNE